ncbi:translocator protein homolog [Ipomoea triloba]|uniref:translocator protein homolog n=1 Tax=Ipomoea triloba TaxID=35885 RepID=UPI00125E6A06|nr:translocator protein homolog [Ipomoea triloba]GLL33060.1 translocator protein homolog [Ipomoea trifida]GMD26787.1 translocator protein homolog [Ipomoea batatas]GMD29859.1 translocator protein homolog [Ipomoea batatas]
MKSNVVKTRRQKARRGLKSLGFALIFPLSLTLLDITLFGSSHLYRTMEKPFWFPRLWALHLSCLGSAFLMGLSAWLVWAEGGFHRHPVAMLLYVCQLGLSLAWDPVVFKAEATRIGMALCVALFGSLLGCSMVFKNVNPIAADLVKPCLGSALLLAVANLKLVYISEG